MKNTLDVFQNLKTKFLEIIPDVLLSLLVLLIGYLVGRLIKYLVVRLFLYLSKLVKHKFHNFNFRQAGSFLGTAFFWVIIFSSILIVTDILGITILTKWFQSIVYYIPNVIAAILIVFAALILSNLVSDGLISLSKRNGVKYSATLTKTIRYVLLLLSIIIALDQIGIEIALLKDIIDIVLAALLFGGSLAFALGSRASVSNILACYYLRKRYKEGDEIQIGKTRGVIIKISNANVVLENDIGQVTIPAKIFNESKSYLIIKE